MCGGARRPSFHLRLSLALESPIIALRLQEFTFTPEVVGIEAVIGEVKPPQIT